jgi:phosphoribosylglycinamide formyltransferase-1
MNIVIIASTGGSVMKALLKISYFREKIKYLVSDRECGAVEVARSYNIPVEIYESKNGAEFSDKLYERFLDKKVDVFVSFYTKIFSGRFISFFNGKLINLHPSILPACPGISGFEDTIKSGSKFIGGTVHFIDHGVDTGNPIIQSATPLSPYVSVVESRHTVFVQQCKMLLQVIRWFEEGRIVFTECEKTAVSHAKYYPNEYSPNLDFDLAIQFNV